jgi:hypothetical protein
MKLTYISSKDLMQRSFDMPRRSENMIKLKYPCPACGFAELYAAEFGFYGEVYCTNIKCTNPTLIDEIWPYSKAQPDKVLVAASALKKTMPDLASMIVERYKQLGNEEFEKFMQEMRRDNYGR